MRKREEHPRGCAQSGKRIYETKELASGAAQRVMLIRRRDVYVYPCVKGGFHVSTVEGARCK